MSHRHFCDFAGHYWECNGIALRPLVGDTEPSICMCPTHQVPMVDRDHGKCPIELLACPEHQDEQLREMLASDSNALAEIRVGAESTVFKDDKGDPISGFCLWCNKDFYSIEEADAHNADDSRACPVLQNLRDEGYG